jgi:hypothetical protein
LFTFESPVIIGSKGAHYLFQEAPMRPRQSERRSTMP